MVAEQVRAPVVREVAPDRVDVVGLVLGVVVLHEECGASNRVVVATTGFHWTSPGERDRGEARVLDPLPVRGGDLVPCSPDVMLHQRGEALLLGLRQVVVADPGGNRGYVRARPVPAQD